jgi:hypothetical protein
MLSTSAMVLGEDFMVLLALGWMTVKGLDLVDHAQVFEVDLVVAGHRSPTPQRTAVEIQGMNDPCVKHGIGRSASRPLPRPAESRASSLPT